MQADRACYVRRAADEQLLEAIAAQRFASVLAPRATGKSSLMGRAIRRLRADGQLAAVVDLSQIGARGETVDAARWHYSIAYRICRELRLRIDLQAWWHDKNLLLNEQRLVEFFFDVVLAHTTAPVTIFFDEAERAVDLPFASELFVALHSCYMRRVSEPDYARLNFVVLGAVAPEQLSPDPGVSPFVGGVRVSLGDFTLEECMLLAPGFDRAEAPADALLARIHAWTHGQPYLTQKLARGVARRGGRLADVDAVLHELFLAPGVSAGESLLGHMHDCLRGDSHRSRQAMRILGRLARGTEVIDDPGSPAQSVLELAGLVSSDDNGMLRYRNRIVEQVFDADWARAAEPRRWQRPAAIAAALVGVLVLLPYWYIEILPARDVQTLTTVTSDYALALEAHRRLGRLPGFGRRADSLLADVMIRRSREAATMDEVLAADAVLRDLRDGPELAAELEAEFWLRRARAAARRGERDPALVYAISAAAGGSVEARAFALQLIDGDYMNLDRSFHLDVPPLALAVDWEREDIVLVDEARRVTHLPLAAGEARVAAAETQLSALQQVGVTRGIFVDDPGRAAGVELRVSVEHARSDDLLLRLQAPSGAAAELALPRRDTALQQFVIRAATDNGLLALADESITGNWELTVFDRLSGATGTLLGWGLRFPGVPQVFDDEVVGGIALPDPVRTTQVSVALSRDGRIGVAIPSRPDARGAVSVWDLTTGEHVGDLPLAERASFVELIGDDRLLVAGGRRAVLWLIGETTPLAEFAAASGLVVPPVVSADGSVFAVAEWDREAPRVTVFDAADGAVLSRFGSAPFTHWAFDHAGSYLAFVDGTRRGRLIDPGSGSVLGEFYHERELDHVVPGASAARVVAVDRDGDIFAWSRNAGGATLPPRDAVFVGSTDVPASLELAGPDLALSYADSSGMVAVRRPADGRLDGSFDHGSGRNPGTRISGDARRLVSVSDDLVRAWHVDAAAAHAPGLGDISAVALGRDGTLGAVGLRSGEVRFFADLPATLDRPLESKALIGHRAVVTSLVFDASGELAASGGSDGTVRIWETASGRLRQSLLRHPPGPIHALAFSPDGRWLASAGASSARVFAVASGDVVNELEVDGEPLALAFAPDSRLVAVGDSAGNIYLATPGGTGGVAAIRGRSAITALAFGTEPGMLASGTRDGDLVLWDSLTLAAIEGAQRFPAAVRWIDLGADAGEIHVLSGAWLFTLDRANRPERITATELLPEQFRGTMALAPRADGGLRGLANAGGGRLALRELAGGPGGSGVDDTGLASRDWARVLGLELDRSTGRLQELHR